MKRSFLAGSLVVMTFVQSIALADLMDLPDPGGDDGTHSTPSTPLPDSTPAQTQYAGSLRLSALSRKTGGTLYKIDLGEAARIQRLDIRVASHRVKIYQTNLVTKSGNKIPVQQLSNTAVIATSATATSENISLNENVTAIEISLEAYDGEAEILLTALASSAVPKLSLRQEVKPANPVVVSPSIPNVTPTNPIQEPIEPSYPVEDGSIVYYGKAFRAGERVLYNQNQVGTVLYVYNQNEISINLDEGYEVYAGVRDLSRSIRCIAGFCQSERVMYGNVEVRILDLFDNQMANVILTENNDPRYMISTFLVNTRLLRKGAAVPVVRTQECTNDRRFCLGDRVQYDGYVVTITKIYSDGTAVVTDAAGSQKVKIRSLREIPRRRW